MDERFARLRMKRVIWWPILASAIVIPVTLVPPRVSIGATLTALAYVFYGVFLIAALSSCRRAGLVAGDIIGRAPSEPRPWLTAALLAPLLLTFSALAVLATLSLAQLGAPEWAAQQANSDNVDFIGRVGPLYRWPLFLMLTIFAPAIEEFVFRGMLMQRWMATRGLWTGLLGSAAVFSLLHPPSWIGSFVFGVVAGILYLWSESLLLPILAHALNNLMVAVALMAGDEARKREAPALDQGSAEWSVLLIALLLVGAAIVAVVRPLMQQIKAKAGGQAIR